jgi:ATP-dependent helicase HrpA
VNAVSQVNTVAEAVDSLPITLRAQELIDAIRCHQVVIVAGATGSGKSTQLPKYCLAAGRGADGRMVGHTQPRRIAARTIAERVAEELGCQLGTQVGYAVRFTDKVGPQTQVKVMTDGILLAEIQRDRMLRRYDTLIIDEAHERSLNIDFLLGYLQQLLPQRPDLTVIVTSATIDTERFSEYFGGAPIITVEGRTYPVEVRYRPLDSQVGAAESRDQVHAVCDAVTELSHEGSGDVLVFLSGEREIHDTADALRRLELSNTEVLPLYARLSSVEQHRIFQPHRGRRVVLSTNVAETSLTVPGVRYVVDAGTARISRYSHRLKVQRLPIEDISRASADQRAGRCGRVAPGICIRLYAEDDYAERPEFTEPEILRTNLASVILQMTALGLGDVAAFPFIEPPDTRSIRDGYQLLEELGALTPGDHRLTPVGRQLARLPIDPRMARMVVAADRHGCVREVMVIAAALSIQDPRDRPAEHRQAADELHRRFTVDEASSSDFLALVKLWDHLRARQQELSGNQFRRLCRSEYLNYLRVREWQDLFSQLRQIAGQLGIRPGTESAHPDRIHQALLAGLLSHLGMRDGSDPKSLDYRGAHGSKFAIGAGSALSKSQPRWVIAAELVETNRLWGRTVAAVQPEWAEKIGQHLTKYSYGEPRWDARSGRAVVSERVSLYGLPIVSNRTIGYDRVDAADAREMFIRHALVEGDWTTHHSFAQHNAEFLRNLRAREDRTRKLDVIDDEAVFAFYHQRVGDEVVSTRHFDKWWKSASRDQPELLTMTAEALGRAADNDLHRYPTTWTQGDLTFEVTYRFDPGADDDGVTMHIPLAVLNRVANEGFDWQVPGFRDDLVAALVQTLPKDIRRELIPMADTLAAAGRALRVGEDPLVVALARALEKVAPSPVRVPRQAFDTSRLPPHLRIGFAVHDQTGAVVGGGKDLNDVKRALRAQMRAEVASVTTLQERRGITSWDFGDLPERIDTERGGHTVHGYPAVLDDGNSVSLRVFTNAQLQARVMRGGVTRLLLLAVPVGKRAIEAQLTNSHRLAVARFGLQTADGIAADCVTAVADRLVADAGEVRTAAGFESLVRVARRELPQRGAAALRAAADIIAAAARIDDRLSTLVSDSVSANVADIRRHLRRLVRAGFVAAHGAHRLDDVLRYVRGIERRLEKVPENPAKDLHKLADVLAVERRYADLLDAVPAGEVTPEMVDVGWTLEELRVSVFAPSLGTARPVSPKRITADFLRGFPGH